MDDLVFDRAVRRYAFEHAVSYAEAARVVVVLSGEGNAVPLAPHQVEEDIELNQQAVRLSAARSISYAEALRTVIAERTDGAAGDWPERVSFREHVALGINAERVVEGQWIEVFRTGRHVSSDGNALTFSQADIDATARRYSPHLSRAPLVLGHPFDDRPAHGWVKEVSAGRDGVLRVRAEAVTRRFALLVRNSHFPKRSAAFFHPRHPANPAPGVWYLRHVGFLGAQPPAVSGLRDLVF
jgi:hypothetical protein